MWHYQLGDALLYAAVFTGMVTVGDALDSYGRAAELSPQNAVISNRIAVAHMVEADWSVAGTALQPRR